MPTLQPDLGDLSWDRSELLGELVGLAESIPVARDEQTRETKLREVLGPELVGLAGRVQRVAAQHQASSLEPTGHCERAHPPAVGTATENELARCDARTGHQGGSLFVDTLDRLGCPIGCSAASLAIGEVEPPDREGSKTLLDGNQCVMGPVGSGTGRKQQRTGLVR